MKLRKRPRLFLEKLEDRTCPALSPIGLQGGGLMLNGSPQGVLTITESAGNVLQIQDSGTNLGHFTVTGNLNLNLTRHPAAINIDLGGNRFLGSINVYLGTGDPASHAVTIFNGTVNGSVTFLNGSGKEVLVLGTPGGPETQGETVTVKGNVFATGRVSAGSSGDSFTLNAGSSILGNLVTTQIDSVNIGQTNASLATIGGAMVVSDQGAGTALSVNIFGTVGGSATVVGTNQADTFNLQQADSFDGGGTIAGSLAVILGQVGTTGQSATLGDVFTLGANTFVGGPATVSAGTAAGAALHDQFTVAGAVGQALSINMGNGNNAVIFSGAVGGSMTVTGGTGTNDLGGGTFGGSWTGTVAGNLTLNLQGTNFFDFNGAGGARVGGRLSYTSGNGNNRFEVSTGGQVVTLNVTFGTGDDAFVIDSAADQAALTGFLDWGDNVFGNDTLTEPGAFVLAWVFKGVQ